MQDHRHMHLAIKECQNASEYLAIHDRQIANAHLEIIERQIAIAHLAKTKSPVII